MFEFGHEVAVKICGVTNIEDARLCAGAGADVIGLNFSPRSVRCITPAIGSAIVGAVRKEFPRIKFAGVFVDQDGRDVQKITTDLALDAVQLHGDENPDFVRELDAPFVIKALRVSGVQSAFAASAYQCDAILLDTWSRDAPGGTGQTFPWSIATSVPLPAGRLILAGGLTSANVQEAIRLVQPFGVDVCSGVESAPGRKDKNKVRTFVRAVHAVTAQ